MPTIEWTRDDIRRAKTNSGFADDELHSEDLTRGYDLGSLTDGLIAYYPFDDDSDDGSTAIDSAQSHDGQINGATHTTDAVVGDTAMSFDGTDDYISTPADTFGTISNFSLSFWIYRTSSSGYETLYSLGKGGNSNDRLTFYHYADNSQLRLNVGNSNGSSNIDSNTSVASTGSWVHCVATVKNGTDVTFYVDGSAAGSASSSYSFADVGNPHEIGRHNGGNYFNGNIDDVRIYNRALSTPEIQALYDLTKPSGQVLDDDPRENLVSHWKLDGDATDSVGSNDGTVNGASFVDGWRNQCANFDGTDDYIGTTDIDLTKFTISAWVNNNSTTNWDTIIGKGELGDSRNYWFGVKGSDSTNSPDCLYLSMEDGSGNNKDINGSIKIADEGWKYVIAIYDGDEIKLYVDGQLDNSTSTSFNIQTNNLTTTLGAQNTSSGINQYFDGEIDDVRIYDRALTPLEVEQLYEFGKRKITKESNI